MLYLTSQSSLHQDSLGSVCYWAWGLYWGLCSTPAVELTFLPVFIKDDLLLLHQWSTSLEINRKICLSTQRLFLCGAMNVITGSCPGCLLLEQGADGDVSVH